jgi:hypothetical protein
VTSVARGLRSTTLAAYERWQQQAEADHARRQQHAQRPNGSKAGTVPCAPVQCRDLRACAYGEYGVGTLCSNCRDVLGWYLRLLKRRSA